MTKKTRKIVERYLRQYQKKENKEWDEIISNRLNQLSDNDRRLIEMRYFENKNINYITYELFMSRCKYFSMIDNILTEIALDAAYYHLLRR